MFSTRVKLTAAFLAGLITVTIILFLAVLAARSDAVYNDIAQYAAAQGELAAGVITDAAQAGENVFATSDTALIARLAPRVVSRLRTVPGYIVVVDTTGRAVYRADDVLRLQGTDMATLQGQLADLPQSGEALIFTLDSLQEKVLFVSRSLAGTPGGLSRIASGAVATRASTIPREYMLDAVLIIPIIIGSAGLAAFLAFGVGELAPWATARQLEIQKAKQARPTRSRFNFVYSGDAGWVYTVRSLDIASRQLKQIMFERQGTGMNYPGLVLTADSATYDDTSRVWRLRSGASRVIAGPGKQATFSFRSMRLRALRQTPADLLAESKGPDEMRFAELGRYIDALKRSGNDANKLIVEQALKLALPVTCLIIALFGAPLAVTTPRAGPAGGVAISLAIALIFLLLTQLTKAIGAGGVINPLVAAWFPNVMFLFAALVLLAKVRT